MPRATSIIQIWWAPGHRDEQERAVPGDVPRRVERDRCGASRPPPATCTARPVPASVDTVRASKSIARRRWFSVSATHKRPSIIASPCGLWNSASSKLPSALPGPSAADALDLAAVVRRDDDLVMIRVADEQAIRRRPAPCPETSSAVSATPSASSFGRSGVRSISPRSSKTRITASIACSNPRSSPRPTRRRRRSRPDR